MAKWLGVCYTNAMAKFSPLLTVFLWIAACGVSFAFIKLVIDYPQWIVLHLAAIGAGVVSAGGVVGAIFGRATKGAGIAAAMYAVFLIFFIPFVMRLADA